MDMPPTSSQTRIKATFVTLMVLSSLSVGFRFLARHVSGSSWWWDDGLVLLAWAFVMSTSSIFTAEIRSGLGESAQYLHNPVSDFIHMNFVGECLLHPSLATIKLVVLFFYARIFVGPYYRKILWAVGTINILWLFGTGIPLLFSCVPLRKIWLESAIPYGHCLNFKAYLISQSSANTIIDVGLICIPIAFVWRLNLGKTQKIALSAVFCVGIFEVGVSIARLVAFARIKYDNITLDYVSPSTWSVVEINVGLMCCSVMAYGPLLKLVRKRFFGHEPSRYRGRVPCSGSTGRRSRHIRVYSNEHSDWRGIIRENNTSQTPKNFDTVTTSNHCTKALASDESAICLDNLSPGKDNRVRGDGHQHA